MSGVITYQYSDLPKSIICFIISSVKFLIKSLRCSTDCSSSATKTIMNHELFHSNFGLISMIFTNAIYFFLFLFGQNFSFFFVRQKLIKIVENSLIFTSFGKFFIFEFLDNYSHQTRNIAAL